MGDPESVGVRGLLVRSFLRYLAQVLTPEQRSSVLAALPADGRALLEGSVSAVAVVPLSTVNTLAMLAAAAREQSAATFGRSAGHAEAEDCLKGTLSSVVRVPDLQFVLQNLRFLWSRLFVGGRISVQRTGKSAVVRVDDVPAHPASCGRITGWLDVLVRRVAPGATVEHDSCATSGEGACTWRITW